MFDREMLKEALEAHGIKKPRVKGLKRYWTGRKAGLEQVSSDPDKGEVLEEIRSIVDHTPETRKALVAEIRRQCDTGTFTVDSSQLADRLLQETILEEIL